MTSGPTDADQRVDARMVIGGSFRFGARQQAVRDPYRGGEVGTAPVSGIDDLAEALEAVRAGADTMAATPGHERAALLERIARRLALETRPIARLLSRESGKAVRDAEAEIARAVDTFGLAAGEAVRIEGRHVPLDSSPMGAGRLAFLLRFPVGVVAAITPFNAPVNLTAHKIAPALAAGNAVILKPPPQTPLAIFRMIEILVEEGCPAGAVNVVYGGQDLGRAMIESPVVDFISFTGSSRAGADIRARAGLRRTALELGGNGVTIVACDADFAAAAGLCARNAMRLAGQSCISVQTVFVDRSLFGPFVETLKANVEALVLGDPLEEATDIGTLIDEDAAVRVEHWVSEAVEGGARVHVGGERHGAAYAPTVLTGVRSDMKVVCDEVFGPVVSVLPFDALDEPVGFVNRSRFGLQCGVFTRSVETSLGLVKRLKVGGVIMNGTSTWRTDQLAYGGVRDSGMGREGPRYAIEEMTDERLVVFNY